MQHLYLWMFGAMLAGHAGTVELPAHRVAEQPVPSAKSVHSALAGRWEGSLRYRDYQDSSRFVTLPTLLVGALSADSSRVQLDFEYDDGPGKTVRSRDAFALDALGKVLTWGAADGKRPPARKP
ncbi:hypothetical protein [Gemmatimonas sp.]|uniref:hypothetical protein n=1 Tax=Gemmatimonas sp. TaxID=1962908 RepID=UPI00333FEEA0